MIEVELYTYLRPELKLGSLEELVTQMREDIVITKDYFKKNKIS
jgi:FAD synthase